MSAPIVLQLTSANGHVTYHIPFAHIRYWLSANREGKLFSRVYVVGKTAGLLVRGTPDEIQRQLIEAYAFADKLSQSVEAVNRKAAWLTDRAIDAKSAMPPSGK